MKWFRQVLLEGRPLIGLIELTATSTLFKWPYKNPPFIRGWMWLCLCFKKPGNGDHNYYVHDNRTQVRNHVNLLMWSIFGERIYRAYLDVLFNAQIQTSIILSYLTTLRKGGGLFWWNWEKCKMKSILKFVYYAGPTHLQTDNYIQYTVHYMRQSSDLRVKQRNYCTNAIDIRLSASWSL